MNTAYKILNLSDCLQQRWVWKQQEAHVVFTNGCFDVLHIGHITLLEQAKSLGHRLVVGLNADSSVRRLKGDSRPIHTLSDRARLLASLACIDAVVGFEEDTPRALIGKILPDILVKGGDYTEEQVVGGDVLKQNDGRVIILPFLEGYSSSTSIEKIQKKYNKV